MPTVAVLTFAIEKAKTSKDVLDKKVAITVIAAPKLQIV